MKNKIVFSSEYIVVTSKEDGYYIESLKKGMPIQEFNDLLSSHPEIRITDFSAVRAALMFAPSPEKKFGEEQERISVEISADGLKAYLTLSMKKNELLLKKKKDLAEEVKEALKKAGVTFGINYDILNGELVPDQKLIIAEGIPPEDGKDAQITMYKLKEIKPEIKEDGYTDHYNLNLINKVVKGSWVGERIDATEGKPGISVRNEPIPPVPGKQLPLFYDKKTVYEMREGNKTVLYALSDGAVNFSGDRINISNYLEIAGDVGFKTGNINFNGYLTIKGSIENNFSVIATKDIEILGVYGIGAVKEIISTEGNIYISGGVFGREKAYIQAKGNVYAKHINDAIVVSGESVHVGTGCLNSDITAKEVVVDSSKGHIIGGDIKAEVRVVSPVMGSPSEKKTHIKVKGFSRRELKQSIEEIMTAIEKLKIEMMKNKKKLEIPIADNNDPEAVSLHTKMREEIVDIYDRIRALEAERKALTGYLRTMGEGEVIAQKRIYPGVTIEMGLLSKSINTEIQGAHFYLLNNDIKTK